MSLKSVVASCIAALFLIACPTESEPELIGDDDVIVLEKMEFEIQHLQCEETRLVARGTVRNKNITKITPYWYVEADFYKDDSYLFKLGGAVTSMNYSLYAGETTQWQLVFSSNIYLESDYPDFAVKNLRAYRRK